MKAKALLLGALLSAFLLVVAACDDGNATETPDGTQTPIGGTTQPTASPGIGGSATPGMGSVTPAPGTQTPGIGTAEPGVGTITPGGTMTPGFGTPTPDLTPVPGIGTVTPGTATPGIGTVEPTPSPSGTAVPLGNVIFVPLLEVNDSGESGAAILVPMGDTTLVAVGLQTSVDMMGEAAIHQGPCETLGEVHTPLASVADSNSLTIVNMRGPELMGQGLSIVLMGTGGTTSDDAIACGDIP